MKNFKLTIYKKLALAIGLTLAYQAAYATAPLINTSTVIASGITVTSTDVFINVLDNTSQHSMAADLGVNLPTFLQNDSSTETFNLGANFSSWFESGLTSGHSFTYNIAAENRTTKTLTNPGDGILLTSPLLTSAPVGDKYTNNFLLQYMNNIVTRVNAVNSDFSLSGGNPEVSASNNQAYFDSTTVPWGTGESTTNNYDSTTVGAGGANTLYAYYISSSAATQKASTVEKQGFLAGSFSLITDTTSANYGNLVWTAPASSIPEPAELALWSLGISILLTRVNAKKA